MIYKKVTCIFFLLLSNNTMALFKLGVESIPTSLIKKVCPQKKKDSCKIGLITNQTGVNQKGIRTIDSLTQNGYMIQYIFTPEHGFNGILAEHDVYDSIDAATGIPIISLYGNGSGKLITAAHMNNVDLLMFDIQDSGMRHYTYISTLLNIMKIAAQYDKPLVVLDRPNPLGEMMEGPLVDQSLISFISIASIPLRHGMTIGELARYFNRHVLDKPAQLYIIKMRGYNRSHGFAGKFIHQLSPNLQSLQSCYGYSFLGLLGEVRPFDVGVGTPMAFRCITLPSSLHVDPTVWTRLQTILSSFGIRSFPYHHINKKNKKNSKGLRLELHQISNLNAFELLITILNFFKKENISLSFSAAFDKAVGTHRVQEIIAHTISEKDFFNTINKDLQRFREQACRSFIYQPFPTTRSARKIDI